MDYVRARIGNKTFKNSFVNYSLCCPSRATSLTGQYAHQPWPGARKPAAERRL